METFFEKHFLSLEKEICVFFYFEKATLKKSLFKILTRKVFEKGKDTTLEVSDSMCYKSSEMATINKHMCQIRKKC